jgi:ABC-type transporter Mla subunit MlaD
LGQYRLRAQRRRIWIALTALLLMVASALIAAAALALPGPSKPDSTDTAGPVATKIANAAATATVASAKNTSEDLTNQLRDLGETLQRISRVISQVEGEYNQHGADLDQLIMDPWMEGNPGLAPMVAHSGPLLPPRQKWVSYSVAELSKLVGMLQGDLARFSQDSFSNDKVKVQFDVLNDTKTQLSTDCQNLVALTQTNLNDRISALKLCQALRDDASGMNEIRKRLLRLTKGD